MLVTGEIVSSAASRGGLRFRRRRTERAEIQSPDDGGRDGHYGQVGRGTKFHPVMTGTGRPAEMTVEFTEFERLRRIVEATNVSNMMVIDGELRFEPVAEGTKMTWVGSAPRRVYKIGPIVSAHR